MQFIANRLMQSVITLFIFIAFTFSVIQAIPGDVSVIYLKNPKITPEARQAIVRQLGLDQPPLQQFVQYVKNVVTGNLGVSFSRYPTPVWDIIAERLPRTVTLFLSATVVSFYVGFVWGRIIAWRRGGAVDLAASGVGVGFWTAFYPLLAILLTWLLGYRLGWLPLNQFIDPNLWRAAPTDANTVFRYLVIDAVAVATVLLAGYGFGLPRMGTVGGRLLVQAALWGGSLAASLAWWAQSGLGRYVLDILGHMVLPILALGLVSFGGTMLLMRDAMMETLREDYVLAARARGLPERVVRDRYAARTALLPVVTSLTLSIGGVASGGVITESLFSWPGIGQILIEASAVQDWPLAVGAFTFTGIFLIVAHIVADLLHVMLDPRLRIRGGEVAVGD